MSPDVGIQKDTSSNQDQYETTHMNDDNIDKAMYRGSTFISGNNTSRALNSVLGVENLGAV